MKTKKPKQMVLRLSKEESVLVYNGLVTLKRDSILNNEGVEIWQKMNNLSGRVLSGLERLGRKTKS